MDRIAFLSAQGQAAALSGFALMVIGLPVQASESEAWAFKFTSAVYAKRDTPLATDENLRGNLGEHTTWVGHYQRGGQFARIGRAQNVNFTTSDQTRFAAGFRF